MSKDLIVRMRDWCVEIRRKPAPIADAVPMVQRGASRALRLRPGEASPYSRIFGSIPAEESDEDFLAAVEALKAHNQLLADANKELRDAAERDHYQIEALQAAPTVVEPEPVAWMSTDCIGERYLCFTKPLDNDPVTPLYAHPPHTSLTVDQAIYALSSALAESKGWLRDYSDTVIRDAIDRRVLRTALTDAEIDELAATNLGDYEEGKWHRVFARAVERAHGIHTKE